MKLANFDKIDTQTLQGIILQKYAFFYYHKTHILISNGVSSKHKTNNQKNITDRF